MDRKIKAPTKAEFLNLFGDLRSQALISGNWMKYGDMWFDLYRRSWLTGRRRAKFSAHQERYLAAIGFDEQDPILDPEAAKYKNLLAGSPDVARARRFILIERMLRGLAVREGGREGSTYVLAAKGRRTAFAEQSLKKEGGFNFDSQHPRLRIEVESAVRHYGCFFFPKTALNVVPVIIMQRQIEITEITT
jgi:hypothetical protein